MARWTILLNPTSGRARPGQNRSRLESALKNVAFSWEILETTSAAHARELAAGGFSHLAAAGGDGMLHHVANGVLQSQNRAVLGVLPMGTGNDFARCLGFGADLKAAVAVLERGNTQKLDAGRLESGGESRFWLNVAGTGFDAVAAERVNRGFGVLKGTAAYLAATLATLRTFEAAPMRVECDETVWEGRAMLCAIANASSYGGGMLVAPGAKLDDGILEVCIIAEATKTEFLRAFPLVFQGKHIHHAKVSMLRGRKIRVESAFPLPVLVDGEVVAHTPFSVEICPGALEFAAGKMRP